MHCNLVFLASLLGDEQGRVVYRDFIPSLLCRVSILMACYTCNAEAMVNPARFGYYREYHQYYLADA